MLTNNLFKTLKNLELYMIDEETEASVKWLTQIYSVRIRTCTNPRFPISKDVLKVWGLDYKSKVKQNNNPRLSNRDSRKHMIEQDKMQ